jgi:Gas vesicle protein K/Gas vesicle protein
VLAAGETSLVDLVDSLIDKGVVVDGEVVLGLAGVDLIYLRLAALLAAADRVMGEVAPSTASHPADESARQPRGAPAGRHVQAEASEASVTLANLPDVTASEYTAVHVRPAGGETLRPASSGEPLSRWNPDPEEVRKGITKLVLTLAEFIKQLLERQAVRRMEAGTLTDEETERLGTALAQVEDTLREMAERAGIDPSELNLDLGPLGKLV